MPPRLQLLSRASKISHHLQLKHSPYQPIAPFLYPFLQTPASTRQASTSILSALSDTPGSYNKRIRRGRGPSSGKGKTAGRGHKGQKQHGKVPAGFNGGQTPDWVVSGSRGFKNHFSVDLAPINLNRIQYWISSGRLDPSTPITLKELISTRCVHRPKDGIKLLARGKEELTSPINIIVSRASAEAIAAVEAAGGTVTTRYYTPFAIRKIVRGEMDAVNSLQSRINDIDLTASAAESESADEESLANALLADRDTKYKYRLPDPTRRKDLEYYRDTAKRGYLSYTVKEGEGPSLFFRTPEELDRMRKAKKGGAASSKRANSAAERLW